MIRVTSDDAELGEEFAPGKEVTVDGQGHTLTTTGADWAIRGASGKDVTLQNITVVYSGDTGAAAPVGGNVVLGENVILDASAVTAEGAKYATGVTVADGAKPEVIVNSGVVSGQTLISGITLGDGAEVSVCD